MSNPVKTILILAANPANTSRLRLDAEVREIEEGLRRASQGGQFRLVQKWAVRSRDFYRAILEHQPQIVHFCGHGTGVDGIVLEDDTGQPTLVDKEALSKLFKLFAVNSDLAPLRTNPDNVKRWAIRLPNFPGFLLLNQGLQFNTE